MTEYNFLEMDAELRKRLGLPDLPFPVRRGKEASILAGEEVQVELLLDELDLFLGETPQARDSYARAAATLAYVVGMRLGREGYPGHAAHYFEVGLAVAPDNLSLRVNYAIALMGSGQHQQALQQCELAIAHPETVGPDPGLWALAARLCMETGTPRRACQLLQAIEPLAPEEDEFWDLLADAEEQAGIAPAAATLAANPGVPLARIIASAPDGKTCPGCGAQNVLDARFCSDCGTKLE